MHSQPKQFYEFGPFRLDAEERLLICNGEVLYLTAKAYEILLMLVQNSGSVIEKDRIMSKVWPNTFVDEANLTQQIFVLRRILSCDEEHQYIETVPRRGYRFASEVKKLEEKRPEKSDDGRTRHAGGDGVSGAGVGPGGSAITSLAILPLVNVTGNSSTEYLSDGITESIINNLSQLRQLRVLAWSAVAQYKGKEIDLQTVGRELRVRAMLTGKVLQIGDRLIIRMELVDVVNGWQLWGEQYNRKPTDLLTLQEDIAWEVSEKLRLNLDHEDKERLAKQHTQNTEAYEIYLMGRYFWNKRSVKGLRKAIEFNEKALEKDPNYALAYAGLSDCYSLYSCYSEITPKEGFLKAKAAALKALSLDENLAEAHASMALVRMLYDWDWTGAEKEFKRALALNPNHAMSHHWYSKFLARMARFDEALSEIRLAQKLDPTSLVIINNIGLTFYMMRNYDRAIQYGDEVLELDRNFSLAYGLLTMSYAAKGMYEDAINYCQIGLNLSDRDAEALGFLANIYARLGARGEALRVLEELTERSHRKYISPFYMALAHIGLEDRKSALDCMEKACDDRSHVMTYLKVMPILDHLHSEPRFKELLKRLGFAS